jgi:hypothetical protein
MQGDFVLEPSRPSGPTSAGLGCRKVKFDDLDLDRSSRFLEDK